MLQIVSKKKLLSIEIQIKKKKTQIRMNKFVYLGLSKPELSKVLMYQSWYHQAKLKCAQKSKLWYMDTGSFIVYIKTDDVYRDIVDHIEMRFDTSS